MTYDPPAPISTPPHHHHPHRPAPITTTNPNPVTIITPTPITILTPAGHHPGRYLPW